MHILAIHGSPRKKGNSHLLLQAVVEGAIAAGAQVETIRVAELAFSPCIHCGGCDDSGRCIFTDDMTQVYEKILAADRIFFAAPIFFYGLPAQAKALIDRCQALWHHHRLLAEKNGWKKDPARKGYYLGVAATHGKKLFDCAILTMKYGLDAMGYSYGGEFLVRGPDKKGDMADYTEELQKAKMFGRDVALGAR